MFRSLRTVRGTTIASLLLLVAMPAWSQVGVPAATPVQFQPRFGIGYVANVPNQFAGVSGHWLSAQFGGFGIYVDAKFDLDSPERKEWYVDSLTVAEVEDRLGDRAFRREGSWTSVNAAVMRPLTPQFTVYAGAGYSEVREYREYIDQNLRVHETGFYWVRDPETSGGRVNFIGGVFMQISRAFALQFGAESQPAGFAVGAAYLIPRR